MAEMLRLVDLRGAGTGHRFAIWDTVVDRFVEIDGDQAWDSWKGDLQPLKESKEKRMKGNADWEELGRIHKELAILDRVRWLLPPWARKKASDEEEDPFWFLSSR